jgi:hypothetical protein
VQTGDREPDRVRLLGSSLQHFVIVSPILTRQTYWLLCTQQNAPGVR